MSRAQKLTNGGKKHKKTNDADVNRLTTTCDTLKEVLKINVDKKNEYSSENERLKKKVNDCEVIIEKLNSTIKKLQNVAKERENENQRFRKKINELTKEKEITSEILYWRKQGDDLRNVCDEKKADANRKMEDFRRENSDLKTMFFKKQCEVDRLLAQEKEIESKTILQEISSDRKTEAGMSSTKTIITCKNVQMGDSNNMVSNSSSNTESKTSQLIEALARVTMEEREKEMQQIKIEWKEMRETLTQLKDELDKLGPTETLSNQTSDVLAEIKDALEVLLTDRSDVQVIVEGVNLLKRQISESEGNRQKLSPLSVAATSRIWCKLENSRIDDLADVFELDPQIIKSIVGTRKLDRSIIVEVLKKWMLQSSENDGERLVERLKRLDASVKEETEKKSVTPLAMKNDDEFLHLSQRYDSVMDGPTKDMHILLLCQWMVDMEKDVRYIKSKLKCDNTK